MLRGKRLHRLGHSIAFTKSPQRHILPGKPRGINQTRPALLRETIPLSISPIKRGIIVQRRHLQHLHTHRRNRTSRIHIHNTRRTTRQLNAIAVHHISNRRTVYTRAIKPIETLTRNPSRIPAMGNHPRIVTQRLLPQSQPHSHRNHHPQTPTIELCSPRQPCHMPGKIQPAPKPLDNALCLHKPKRRQRRIIPDTRMRVLNRISTPVIIRHRQRHQQPRDQFQSPAQMVQFPNLCQRRQRPNRRARALNLQRRQRPVFRFPKRLGRRNINMQPQNIGRDLISEKMRILQQRIIALPLPFCQRLHIRHNLSPASNKQIVIRITALK